MRRIKVVINKNNIVVDDDWVIDEEKYPELRRQYDVGVYKAFLDKMSDPYRIKFMKKIGDKN